MTERVPPTFEEFKRKYRNTLVGGFLIGLITDQTAGPKARSEHYEKIPAEVDAILLDLFNYLRPLPVPETTPLKQPAAPSPPVPQAPARTPVATPQRR